MKEMEDGDFFLDTLTGPVPNRLTWWRHGQKEVQRENKIWHTPHHFAGLMLMEN